MMINMAWNLFLLVFLLALFVPTNLAFTMEPAFSIHRSMMTWPSSRVVRSFARTSTTTSTTGTTSALLADKDPVDPSDAVVPPATTTPPPIPPVPPKPQSRLPPKKQLDPLVASVTRMDPGTTNSNTKTAMVPFFGELPVDGSLLVLIPAALIGVVGFVMSIVVAWEAKDTFVDQLSQLSDEINAAALAKTNVMATAAADGTNSCRGLCSSQEEQLESMRIMMQGLSKK